MSTALRHAPPGFTHEQWEEFQERGILVIPDVLSEAECDHYIEAIDAIAADQPDHDPEQFFTSGNAVTKDPRLAELIDRDTHIGYAYDLYGEQTKVHRSNIMRRPFHTKRNPWHPDGARMVPCNVFSPELPLVIKFFYWFTDLPHENMGNLTVLPGSHRDQTLDAYYTRDVIDGEYQMVCKRGTMTIMDVSLWHKVAPNESDQERYSAFMAYSPSWISPADRYQDDPAWLATLKREQRILMHSYDNPYNNHRPPVENTPLFLDRDTGADREPDIYPDRDDVTLAQRKRLTFHEKLALAKEAKS